MKNIIDTEWNKGYAACLDYGFKTLRMDQSAY